MTCRSACENLMVACQNQKDLWRCGESQYFNGYEAEEPENDVGDPVYLRDFFPGNINLRLSVVVIVISVFGVDVHFSNAL